jgi:sarcosine oxidase, subunit gamma
MADLSAARQGPSITSSALVRELPPLERHVLRGDSQALAAAAQVLGLEPPPTLRSVAREEHALLWLGPDELLLLCPAGRGSAIGATLDRALQPHPHSRVEVSHRQLALSVSGRLATTVLNAGCPLDLDLEAFPIGMCTRTVLGKAEIVLWRLAPQSFHLEVARSFAPYVSLLLATASREYLG